MRSVTFRAFLGVILASTLASNSAIAQQAPQQPAPQPAPTQPTGPGGGQQGPSQPGGGREQIPGRQPFPGTDRRQDFPDMERQRIFMLSGKVMLDDGTPPPEPVVIERVCNGMPRPEGYTDSKGRFSIQLGQNQAMMMDASVGSAADGFGMPGSRSRMPGDTRGGISERDLMGCELRASLPGFRSDVINLAGRRALDNPDVGTIVLRRLAKVDGFTFSATSAFAPKNARKAYEKGREAAKKKKWENAEKELTKATTEYDKYAAAWFELGRVYQAQSKLAEAKQAYEQSVKADGKFINPYAQLASLAANEKNWQETADYTAKVIQLNPYISPDVYFLSGVANLNLNKLEPAEDHAREALKMDEKHRNPRIAHLLGIILAQKQDYAGAAEQMRAYLQFAPDAADADQVKKQIAEVERMLNARTGATPAQQ